MKAAVLKTARGQLLVGSNPTPSAKRTAMSKARGDGDKVQEGDPHPAHLVSAIASTGDRAAFAALFTRFAPRANAYLLRLGLDSATAEEHARRHC